MTMTITHTYEVPDISCGHCVAAIEGEVGPLAGVESVSVDLDDKLVTVLGGDDVAIRAAIDEAGYDIAG
ncbi:MAG: heavy-metal-associated domain-containing protein [Actinomycetia bacterium]|nr:heavy-metal-associated domain-containing protein [Actinomycetes bacterium]